MSETSERTYAAVQSMAAELPGLVGKDWPQVARQLAELDVDWVAADETRRIGLAAAYRTTLAPYPEARKHLAATMGALSLYGGVLLDVAALVEQLGDDDGAVLLRESARATSPHNTAERRYMGNLKTGRTAQSFKWHNVEFTFWSIAAAIGSLLTTIATVTATGATPIAIAGAVALLIAALAKPFVIKIDADIASVFLGLARAAGLDHEAALVDIVAATNTARREGGLHFRLLTEEQVLDSLSSLSAIGSVASVDSEGKRWRIIEEHGAV
ncbi:MAG: hypothetical protein K1X50_13340 [Candidatus Promineofilum sp.]|nr:hypothetical protein [Promineifilum sp.]